MDIPTLEERVEVAGVELDNPLIVLQCLWQLILTFISQSQAVVRAGIIWIRFQNLSENFVRVCVFAPYKVKVPQRVPGSPIRRCQLCQPAIVLSCLSIPLLAL